MPGMQTLRSKTLDIDIFAKADWTLFGESLDHRGGWWCVVSRVQRFSHHARQGAAWFAAHGRLNRTTDRTSVSEPVGDRRLTI